MKLEFYLFSWFLKFVVVSDADIDDEDEDAIGSEGKVAKRK